MELLSDDMLRIKQMQAEELERLRGHDALPKLHDHQRRGRRDDRFGCGERRRWAWALDQRNSRSMKRGVLTCLMTVLLMGADCGQTLHDCPEVTAIPNVNFENGSRECIPFDEICFAEDRSSTIACADCPTCDPYEPPDAGVPDGSVDGDVPDGEVPECETDADCDLEAEHDAGDHTIAIGRVRDLELVREGEPLLFFRGAYGSFGPLESTP